MAGEWIKVRTNLWDDPRVGQLCETTAQAETTIIGGLYWLWATADEHTETGLLPGMSLRTIDRKTGIKGFGAALVSVGWLLETPEGVVIERFEEHNGTSAKNRAQTAKRVANHRSNGPVTQPPLADNADGVTGPLAREEKRREEKIPIDPPVEDKKKVEGTRGSRLPADWKPSTEDVAYCKTERPDLLPSRVAQNFFDYWIAQPGAKGRKADWSATWRSWVRKERTENAPRPPGAAGVVVGFPQGPRPPAADQMQANTDAAKRLLFGDDEGRTVDA